MRLAFGRPPKPQAKCTSGLQEVCAASLSLASPIPPAYLGPTCPWPSGVSSQELCGSQPYLQAAWRLATVETKKVLKRLVLPTDPSKRKEACRWGCVLACVSKVCVGVSLTGGAQAAGAAHGTQQAQGGVQVGVCVLAWLRGVW